MKSLKIPSIKEIVRDLQRETLSPLSRGLVSIVEVLYLWYNELIKDRCPQRAASLTYTTLLAIFPLIAVVALFVPAIFGGYEEMHIQVIRFLEEILIPSAGQRIESTIRTYFDTFRENSVGVGFFGVIGLMLSAVALFASVDKSFNAIWMSRSRRSKMHLFTRFTSMLILIPIFIGGSIMLTVELKSRLALVGNVLAFIMPYLLTCSALTLAFYMIPNTRVNFLFAVIGGVTSGLLWEIAKVGFSFYVAAPQIGLIIKSLGVIPIFLIWIYFSWLIVLVGCEFAFVLQFYRRLQVETFSKRPCITIDSRLIFLVFMIIADHFQRNLGGVSFQSLISKVPIKVPEMEQIIELLKGAGIITESQNGTFILARPLEYLQPEEILTLGCNVDDMFIKKKERSEAIHDTLLNLQNSLYQWAKDKRLRDFFPSTISAEVKVQQEEKPIHSQEVIKDE